MQIRSLPTGFRFLYLENQDNSFLRLALVVRTKPDPVAGYLVNLSQSSHSQSYLGALVDSENGAHQFLEIFCRMAMESSLQRSSMPMLSTQDQNAWIDSAHALQEANPQDALAPYPCPAMLLDCPTGKLRALTSEKENWTVCRDEALLESVHLPSYDNTQHRYLYNQIEGEVSYFIPLSKSSPRNDVTKELGEVFPTEKNWTLFNPLGDYLISRVFSGVSLADFNAILSGARWTGLDSARVPFMPKGVYEQLTNVIEARNGYGFLFFGSRGLAAELAEVLYIKTQLLADIFRSARGMVEHTRRPLFHVAPENIQVRFGSLGGYLPALWNFQCTFNPPTEVFTVPVPTEETRYFGVRSDRVSVYRPEAMSKRISAEGTLRIREVVMDSQDRVSVKATLVVREKLDPSASDLVQVMIPVGDASFEVYGEISVKDSLAHGEVRFTSLARSVEAKLASALKESEGVPFHNVPYNVMPAMRTPCDVYSLAVLGVQFLLVNSTNTLATALDEAMSLARELDLRGVEHGNQAAGMIATMMEEDARWRESLGPHRLLDQALETEGARASIPPELWAEVIAFIVRCFPGVGRASFHRDLGDVVPFALEAAFDEPMRNLHSILIKLRGRLLGDDPENVVIRGAIQSFRACLR